MVELQGQVLVRDVIDGSVCTEEKSQEQNRESNYLILKGKKDFSKSKVLHIHNWLKKYGAVSYMGFNGKSLVVKFFDRESVDKIMDSKYLTFNYSSLEAERLSFWLPKESHYLEFKLDPEILSIMSTRTNLLEKISTLKRKAAKLTLPTEKPLVCKDLESLMSKNCFNANALAFGSRLSGLALDTSDLDIFLDYGEMFHGKFDQDSRCQAEIVKQVTKILRKSSDYQFVTAVPHCRVPVIRFLHTPSQTRCDVVFRNGLGNRNTALIRFLMSLDDRISSVILFLKYWVMLNEINDITCKNRFTSYALTLMVITYLQVIENPILPPISFFQKNVSSSCVIAGWETAFSMDKSYMPMTKNKKSVPQLIAGFFDYYYKLNFSQYVISPREGNCIHWKKYTNQELDFKSPITVEDPFELNKNATVNISESILCKIQGLFGCSRKVLGWSV